MVSRPRLRQRRRDQRPPHPRPRASARGRLEGDPRRPRGALPGALEQREARARGRPAPSHADRRHHAARSRRQVCRALSSPGSRGDGFDPHARARADGAEPGPGSVGAGHQLLGGRAGALAHPHADHERRELPRPGRQLRPHRPVSPSLLGVIARAGDGSRVRQGNPQVLLDPRQHRLRRHDPGRRQPGHHLGLRSAHHPLGDGRRRRGHDQRPDLRHSRGHRRDEPDPRAQAQRAAAPELAGRASRQGGRDDRLQPGCALPAQLRRALHGRHAAPGEGSRRRAPHPRATSTSTRRSAASRTPWWATTARARWTTT